MIDIAGRRLQTQRLTGEPLSSAVDVVRLFGAVQAQDYSGSKWGIGQRTVAATDAGIDRLLDDGAILRTHVMRPTWHYVLPEDIRWLLDLTGPRVRRTLDGMFRRLGIEASEVTRATATVCGALTGGRFLTRPQLGDVLSAAGISTASQRLSHLLMAAELEGAIVSGPGQGKQRTYALLAERAPGARTLDRPEAVVELTRRYFTSHGPAQLQDFVWWSGLAVSDARAGLASIASDLDHAVVEGKEYWFGPDDRANPAVPVRVIAHLLPNWDEYTVGYRDRAAALPAGQPVDLAFFPFGSVLSNVVTVAGRVRGTWRRIIGRERVRIELRWLDTLDQSEVAAAEAAAHRLGAFLEMPVELV
jgi:hypothetical protein